MIIGAPGAGKTTALVNSGCSSRWRTFGSAGGIGGTRNCDWWFTNEAVLLDTAGRYTTQRASRSATPASGIIFRPAAQISRPSARQWRDCYAQRVRFTDASPEAQRNQAIALRQRLMELHDRLGIRFPVYVLVTKPTCSKVSAATCFAG